jgi:FixJ family two-component response regulator
VPVFRNGFAIAKRPNPPSVHPVPYWIPDLAILDGRLPDTSGINFAIQLKTVCPACNIILFSGRPIVPLYQDHPKKPGYNFAVHAKPTPPNTLLDTVWDCFPKPNC